MPLPLEGMLVIALEQAVAAPFASRQLADLGARVIKIERATGDFARGYDGAVGGLSSYFVWLNRGKESVVLDVKDPDDFAVLRQMIERADVFIQNLAPGAVQRLGLGPDAALRMNPRLVHASISGYGGGGDYEHKKAYDLLIQCETGLLSVTGTTEHPSKVGISIADISAGMYAFSGVLTALLARERTGRGDVIEISMLESMGEWMSQPMYFARESGRSPQRSGAQHASIAPYGPFDASDGVVFLAVQNEREWVNFCTEILRKPELAADPRFESNTARVRNRSELHGEIGLVLRTLSVEDALERLESSQIANAQLRSMQDFADHPQLQARDRWRTISTSAGPLSALVPPGLPRGLEPRMGDVPTLGSHTASAMLEFRPSETSGIHDLASDGTE